ncbi:MAG: gliding motility-associated protein GldE [Chitinophagaceae bacterium]
MHITGYHFLNVQFPRIFLAANVQGTTLVGIIILLLVILSFCISGAEVAFFSLTYKDINTLKTKQGSSWKRIVTLLEEPKLLLTSMLIANTLINISIIILSNFIINELMPEITSLRLLDFFLKVIVVSSVLLLFCEVLPKVWATQNNFRFAYNCAFIVEIVHYVFRRASTWLVSLSESVEKFLGKRASNYSLEELDHAIDLSTNNDASEEEKNILKGIVNFGQITVKQVMRTRMEVNGIEFGTSYSDLINTIRDLHYSRLPVYKSSLDDIVGIMQTKDLVPHIETPDFDWHSLIRPPYFVHEQKLIEDLLKEFQLKHVHFAIVVDEFGGTSGIVTLEDILEEIIGEIEDEFDDEDSANKKIDENNYVFEGRTMINDVCKMLGLPVDSFDKVRGESDSLGGLLLEIAGDFPKKNDIIRYGDYSFTVQEVANNRVQKIKVEFSPAPATGKKSTA